MDRVEILVLDFGSQYTQLIARRLRECGVYAEIVPYFETFENIKAKHPKGIILSGGPASVYEEGAYKPDSKIFGLGVPVLGICYGMQYIADFFGGRVIPAQAQEFGKVSLELLEQDYEIQTIYASQMNAQNLEKLLRSWEKYFRKRHNFMDEAKILSVIQDMCEILKNSDQTLILLRDDDVLGFMSTKDNAFDIFFTSDEANFKNFGKIFLREALEVCFKKYEEIEVTCLLESMDAIAFYQQAGFEIFKENAIFRGTPLLNVQLRSKTNTLRDWVKSSAIFEGIKRKSIVWMSHADKVEVMPEGFVALAKSENTQCCAIADFSRRIYALQFHPEVVQSECGGEILKNFAVKICGTSTDWNMHRFAQTEIIKLREIIKDGKVLCGVSGGVDSSVVATLLHRAIKERLIPVFVDHGLLRAGEREAVEAMFKKDLGIPLISVDASELFLSKLAGIKDPEKKRKIIGETFIEVFEKEAKKYHQDGEIKFLAQGTLYPDVIESVSVKGPSKTIKSHHNVGGLPEWMKFELIEPLRELFKDEVRELGRELGIPQKMLMRHPFPGPGLAIRIMGDVNRADLDLLKKADAVFLEELHKSGYYDKVWQAFCVLLNVKSVGVMGDNRTYDNTICVRAVIAVDGMTASFAYLPHELLENVSSRIINEVGGVNRVVYDITSKPPGTIEWE